jgi:hypothetical protein
MSSLNTVLLTTNSLSKNLPTNIFQTIENDKFFISLIGIVVFLSGRSLYNELYSYCSNEINILDYHYVKKITLWSVLFLYSRSILHASILSNIIILLFPTIFFTDIYKEKSKNIF